MIYLDNNATTRPAEEVVGAIEKSLRENWGNSEVMAEWFVLNINCGNREIRPEIEKFISKVGRRKFLLPIYKALVKNPEDKVWAKKVFDKSKAYYHAVSRNSIAELFND